MQVSFYVNHKKIYDVIKKFLYKKKYNIFNSTNNYSLFS